MSLVKRDDSKFWWVDFAAPSGKRIRRSTGTANKKAAQEFCDRLKSELWRQDKLGEEPDRTFEEAAVRFLQLSEGQRDYKTKVRHVRYWRDEFTGRPVSSLTTERIMDALPTHQVHKHKGPQKLSPATKNRYLSTIRRILSLCEEWRWIHKAPKLRPYAEPEVRVRWITEDEAYQLLAATPRHWLKHAIQMALATGMRAGEILKLEWSEVDLKREVAWITAEKSKSFSARVVPLNELAIRVIQARIGTHPKYVFTRNGNPQTQIDPKMFRRACEKAGIDDFTFHDLRHTWASWHVQKGTPLFALKELGGWKTLEMVKKYAHLGTEHLSQYANNVTFMARLDQKAKTPPLKVALSS